MGKHRIVFLVFERTRRGDKMLMCKINNINNFSVSAQADLPQA